MPGPTCEGANLFQLYTHYYRRLPGDLSAGWLAYLNQRIEQALAQGHWQPLARWLMFYLSESWDRAVLSDAVRLGQFLSYPLLSHWAARLGRVLYPSEALFRQEIPLDSRSLQPELPGFLPDYWSHLLCPRSQPGSLSVCMIVRNAADTLVSACESLAPIAGEFVIADTGSEDHSLEVIAQLSRRYPVKLLRLPWHNHFAQARNQVLRQASGEWVLSLDADEVMSPESLNTLAELLAYRPAGPQIFALRCESRFERRESTLVDWVFRLFPHHAQIRYWGALHERPGHAVLAETLPIHVLAGPKIEHDGYLPAVVARHQKHRRDAYLAQSVYIQGLPNPYFVYHQACILLKSDHSEAWAEAERLLQLALQETRRYPDRQPVPGWFLAPLNDVMLKLQWIWLAQQRWQTIYQAYRDWCGWSRFPLTEPVLHYWYGVAALYLGHSVQAHDAFQHCLTLRDETRPYAGFTSVFPLWALTKLAHLQADWQLGCRAWMHLLAKDMSYQLAYLRWWEQMLQLPANKGASVSESP